MSKKRRKQRPAVKKVRKRSGKAAPRERWTWKDKLLMWGTLPAILIVVTGLTYGMFAIGHRRRIEERVNRWRIEHDLSEAKAHELLKIESDFHQMPNPFTLNSAPSDEEVKAHQEEVSQALYGEASGPVKPH